MEGKREREREESGERERERGREREREREREGGKEKGIPNCFQEHKRKSLLPDIFIVRFTIYTTLLCITECIALSLRLCTAKTNKETRERERERQRERDRERERERERDKHMSFHITGIGHGDLLLVLSLSVSFLLINDCPVIGDSHDGQIYVCRQVALVI